MVEQRSELRIRVRTLKIQSQTVGLTGKFIPISVREQGVTDEGTIEKDFYKDGVNSDRSDLQVLDEDPEV